MRYLTRYIKSHLSLSVYNGDPDNDYAVDMIAGSNSDNISDFLDESLSEIIDLCITQPSTIFRINNAHVQELYDIYDEADSEGESSYVLFHYLVYGNTNTDMYEVEGIMYDIVEN